MRKYFPIYEEAVSHIHNTCMTLQLHSEFPYIWGKLVFLFYQCTSLGERGWAMRPFHTHFSCTGFLPRVIITSLSVNREDLCKNKNCQIFFKVKVCKWYFNHWIHYVERIIYIESFAQNFENVELQRLPNNGLHSHCFNIIFFMYKHFSFWSSQSCV